MNEAIKLIFQNDLMQVQSPRFAKVPWDKNNYPCRYEWGMFSKAKCRICGDEVRFALKHLNDKHNDIVESQVKKMKLQEIMKKYFID